jgi:hypothetical protein
MLGTVPELQKAGGAEYEQAGKERAGGQQTAAGVLKIALGQKEAEMRLKELENQGIYQRGQLAIGMGQLKEATRGHKEEERIRDVMTRTTVPTEILKNMTEDERRLAQLDQLEQSVPGLSWLTSLVKPAIQASHAATKKTVEGYRAMGAQGIPAEAPAAPGPVAAAAGPHTHYRYSADGLKRLPTDAAGNPVGPAEVSKTPWPR